MYHYVLIRMITACVGGGATLVTNYEKPYDYSKYLGPGYKKTMPEGKKVPTIVFNHCGLMDGLWFV